MAQITDHLEGDAGVQLEPPSTGRTRPSSHLTTKDILERIALPLTWVAIIIAFTLLRPEVFPTSANAASILASQAILVVAALAALSPLTVGDLDVSIGSIAGMSAMIVVILSGSHQVNVGIAILVALGVSAFVGLLNGFFSVALGLDTLIVTLATGSLVAGCTAWMSGNETITGVSRNLVRMMIRNKTFGVANEFYFAIALCLAVAYVLRYTPLGRRMLIVGQAREVAELSGINVARVRMGSLLASALMAGLAGVMFAGTSGSAQPGGGTELLLPAYAAAFLGATTINPGRFNAFGAVISVYFLATLITGLEMMGAKNFVTQICYGGALLVAVAVSTIIRRLPARREAAAAT